MKVSSGLARLLLGFVFATAAAQAGLAAVSAAPTPAGLAAHHMIVAAEPDSPAARAFVAVAEQAAAQVSIASYTKPTIPLTVVR